MAPTKKKQPLTFAQLSAYDDILTDALVDHVYYWTTIPKNHPLYHPSRRIREETIARIIQQELIVKKDLDAAEKQILAIDGIKRFRNTLRTDDEQAGFRQHFLRYLRMYLPDCPWEVNTTNRYTVVAHEASVTARKPIKKNESIKYLCGILVNITPEEEDEISVRKKDFSIVVSSRSKCTSLFMGPARFANHDCDANAKLITAGQSRIEIVATRAIEVGEEITITYSSGYFGTDNCECLCKTCEDNLRNGWAQGDGIGTLRASIEVERPDGYCLRRRRRNKDQREPSRTASSTPDLRSRLIKTRPSYTRDSYAVEPSSGEDSPPKRKRVIDALNTPPMTPAKRVKHQHEASQLPREDCSRASSVTVITISSDDSDAENRYTEETDVTIPEKSSLEPSSKDKEPAPLFRSIEQSEGGQGNNPRTVAEAAPLSPQSSNDARSRACSSESDTSEVSLLSIAAMISLPKKRVEKLNPIVRNITVLDDSDAEVSNIDVEEGEEEATKQQSPPRRRRAPRDYILTDLLLCQPEMAWVQCLNCDSYFVQQNAYATKSSCPRCERHSKLYGYVWPKTDKTGLNDKEERILDHRLIHRYLDADNERRIHKRKHLKCGTRTEDSNSDGDSVPKGTGTKPKRSNLAGPVEVTDCIVVKRGTESPSSR